MDKLMKAKGTVASTSVGGAIAIICIWYWNATNPDMQMGAEPAMALGTVFGAIMPWLASWIPSK